MTNIIDKNMYMNPLIEKRADPYIYKHTDGYYYFTASVPTYDCVILRRAKTIEGLSEAEEKVIWKKHENGIMSEHIWAPEIHYINNSWYIYFAAGDKDDIWEIRPYVLECSGNDPINDEWIEKGALQCADTDEFSFRAFSLDVTIFEHKSKLYCVWAEKVSVGRQISNLYIAEMESPYKLKTDQVLLTTPDYDWERVGFWVNEGPAVLKKKGKIFLTYSASETGAEYCMGMLCAGEDDDLLDPKSWDKYRYPVLKTNENKKVYGPGHNSFTVSEDGEKDILVFHARPYEKIEGNPLYDENRHAFISEIKWNVDGTPNFEFM